MTAFVLTVTVFTLLIAGVEWACWSLFRRKMETMRFPSPQDPTGSHSFYLSRLRKIAVAHTAFLTLGTWILCIIVWW